MSPKITFKQLKDLTEAETTACLELSLNSKNQFSLMSIELNYNKHNPNSYAYLMTLDNKLIAWALVTLSPCNDYEFNVFVAKSYRRQGLGTALYRAALKEYQDLVCYPHDPQSKHFYTSVENNNQIA